MKAKMKKETPPETPQKLTAEEADLLRALCEHPLPLAFATSDAHRIAKQLQDRGLVEMQRSPSGAEVFAPTARGAEEIGAVDFTAADALGLYRQIEAMSYDPEAARGMERDFHTRALAALARRCGDAHLRQIANLAHATTRLEIWRR